MPRFNVYLTAAEGAILPTTCNTVAAPDKRAALIADEKLRGYHAGNRSVLPEFPALTVDQCVELRAFAAEEGRKWKDVLQKESWWRGIPMRGYPTLYGLRNTHGPLWLEQFKLASIALGASE